MAFGEYYKYITSVFIVPGLIKYLCMGYSSAHSRDIRVNYNCKMENSNIC